VSDKFTGDDEEADALIGVLFGTVAVATGEEWTGNAFCPTGPGGGVDATCSPGHAGKFAEKHGERHAQLLKAVNDTAEVADRAVFRAMTPTTDFAERDLRKMASQKAVADYQTATKAYLDHIEQARNELMEHQGGDSKLTPVMRGGLLGSTPTLDAGTQEAANFIGKMVKGGMDAKVNVTPILGSRSGYDIGHNTVYAGTAEPSVLVHEFGHALEEHVPGLKDAAIAFRERRIGTEKPIDLSRRMGLSPGEEGYEDEFTKTFGDRAAYVGKIYRDDAGHISSTEIVSMGLEQMHNDPVHFAKADPDYFNFLLGALDARKR
jgi:hypothetical protein